MDPMIDLRRLCSIAWVEWNLQRRSLIFWVSLALVLLYRVARQIGVPGNIIFLPRQWLGARETSLEWIAITLIFLAPSALIRDHRTGAFIWTTPVSGVVYASGKLLGLWLTTLTLAGIELIVQFLPHIATLKNLGLESLSTISNSLIPWIVNLLYVTSVYFLLTVLSNGQSLLAYGLNTIFLIIELSIRDIANPVTLFPSPVIRSDLVGNGPETLFFDAHLFLYTGLLLFVTFLALWFYPRREKRSLSSRGAKNSFFPVFVFSLSVIALGMNNYAQASTQLLKLPRSRLYTPPTLAAETVKNVYVKIEIDPQKERMAGNLELHFAQSVSSLVFYVPPGLQISKVTNCQGRPLSFNNLSVEWVQIIPDLQICATFQGVWQASRVAYDRNLSLNELNTGVYIGGGYAYLTPKTRYYPAPIGSYEWQSVYQIEVKLPSAFSSIAASPTFIQKQDGWTTYRWESLHGKPLAALAIGKYVDFFMSDGVVVSVAPGHILAAESAAAFYLEFLQSINQLVHNELPQYHIVEVPVLRSPVITGTTVFLPERFFYERLLAGSLTDYLRFEEFVGPQQTFLRETYYVTREWLQGQISFVDVPLTAANIEPIAMPLVDPYAIYQPLPESLAHYLALQLTDQKFGSNLLDQAMTKQFQQADPALSQIVLNDFEVREEFTCMFIAFGKLEHRVGRNEVIRMISLTLQRYSGQTMTIMDWLKIVNEIGGLEARQEFEGSCFPPTP